MKIASQAVNSFLALLEHEKKRLKDAEQSVLSGKNVGRIAFAEGLANLLLYAANELPNNQAKDDFLGGYALEARYWLRRLVRHGCTENLVNKLNDTLSEHRAVPRIFRNPRDGTMVLKVVQGSESDSIGKVDAIFDFANVLCTGALDGLKQCAADDCQNFFLRDPRATFCTRVCGNRDRMRKMRKRRRVGGVYDRGKFVD